MAKHKKKHKRTAKKPSKKAAKSWLASQAKANKKFLQSIGF